MIEDVDYCPAISIADLPITSPIHKPCPDMVGLADYEPDKTERARSQLSKLRETLGIRKRVKPTKTPLTYVCTEQGCLEPWQLRRKPKRKNKTKRFDNPNKEWQQRLDVKKNQLPNRAVQRQEQNEAAQHELK